VVGHSVRRDAPARGTIANLVHATYEQHRRGPARWLRQGDCAGQGSKGRHWHAGKLPDELTFDAEKQAFAYRVKLD
jgi:hypothetical protein